MFLSLVRLQQWMDAALRKQWPMVEQDERISDAVAREQSRLRNFIRRRVADPGDAEDILQEVFYEFVEAYRMMKPVEHVTGWLYRVARNRITDLFRKKNREGLQSEPTERRAESRGGSGAASVEELLPSSDAGPDAAYARSVLLERDR